MRSLSRWTPRDFAAAYEDAEIDVEPLEALVGAEEARTLRVATHRRDEEFIDEGAGA